MHPIPFQPAHPVSFLSLVSFGSLLPIKSPVTLQRGRDRQQGTDSGGQAARGGSASAAFPSTALTLGPMRPSFPGMPGGPDRPRSPWGTEQMSISHQPCIPLPARGQCGAYRLAFPPGQTRAPRDSWLSLQRAGERQGSHSFSPQCSPQSHRHRRGPHDPVTGSRSGLSHLPAPAG